MKTDDMPSTRTVAGKTTVLRVKAGPPQKGYVSVGTSCPAYEEIRHLLVNKPLRVRRYKRPDEKA